MWKRLLCHADVGPNTQTEAAGWYIVLGPEFLVLSHEELTTVFCIAFLPFGMDLPPAHQD